MHIPGTLAELFFVLKIGLVVAASFSAFELLCFVDVSPIPQKIPRIQTSKMIIEPLSLCPESSPNLVGPLSVDFEPPTFEEIAAANPLLKRGGRYKPSDCIPRNGPTTIIIPFRDRELHLRGFLHHVHPILQRQLLEYVIIVVEQAGNGTFNKGVLMNVGYKESLKLTNNTQCYIFHDVDMLPEDDRGMYTCSDKTIHLGAYVDKFNYTLLYRSLIGGATAFPRPHFELVNGYSNVFFGWGGEDDDMFERLHHFKLPVARYAKEVLRYKMYQHDRDLGNSVNPNSRALLRKSIAKMRTDGFNSLGYKIVQQDEFPTFTRILVEFNEADVYRRVFGTPTVQL